MYETDFHGNMKNLATVGRLQRRQNMKLERWRLLQVSPEIYIDCRNVAKNKNI